MTREHKHVIIYGAFGLLLGAKVVEVILTRSDVGFFDYWLLLIGVTAAVIHYLPTTEHKRTNHERGEQSGDREREQGSEDTLVLRNHTHIKRSPPPRRDAAPLSRRDREADPFV